MTTSFVWWSEEGRCVVGFEDCVDWLGEESSADETSAGKGRTLCLIGLFCQVSGRANHSSQIITISDREELFCLQNMKRAPTTTGR